MSLPAPRLDDRQFQDIVDEVKQRIRLYCPEWTDHNVSDPGVTLIELFAWMTDLILYRLNLVPTQHYIKFMELLGITLQPPEPAHTAVTFWLSAPQPNPVTIPAATEVASTQTETALPVVFTTDEDLQIEVARCACVIANGRGQTIRRFPVQFDGGYVDIFSETPAEGDALYFGFENDLSNHVLRLDLDFDRAHGAGIVPDMPPYDWQVSTGDSDARWRSCGGPDLDTTRGMNSPGRIQVFLPQMGRYTVNKQELYWVRARVKQPSTAERDAGMRQYRTSPRLRQIGAVEAIGAAVPATHAQFVIGELLGVSDGSPGQRFQLQSTPVLTRTSHERLFVQAEGQEPEGWTERPDFADSTSSDPHYTLDAVTGEVRFGPSVRLTNGEIRQYGKVPSLRAKLLFNQYRCGGGIAGNVQPGELNTLKTSIPYIARVSNRAAAVGGNDPETLEAAMARTPKLLRSRQRAVTAEDFEFMAEQALPGHIGRVKCIQPTRLDPGVTNPGQIHVLLIPKVELAAGYLEPNWLDVPNEDMEVVRDFLDRHRLLTTRLNIAPPAYHWVAVTIDLYAPTGVDRSALRDAVLRRLYAFLNPLTGGPGGDGWPFGRDLYEMDVYQCLQGVSDQLIIRELTMESVEMPSESRAKRTLIDVLGHGVIASHRHTVNFV